MFVYDVTVHKLNFRPHETIFYRKGLKLKKKLIVSQNYFPISRNILKRNLKENFSVRKISFLFRSRRLFTTLQLLTLYNAQIQKRINFIRISHFHSPSLNLVDFVLQRNRGLFSKERESI